MTGTPSCTFILNSVSLKQLRRNNTALFPGFNTLLQSSKKSLKIFLDDFDKCFTEIQILKARGFGHQLYDVLLLSERFMTLPHLFTSFGSLQNPAKLERKELLL